MNDEILHGNWIDIMAGMPANSVDFILTDPPYIANYKSRPGQRLVNDDNAAWLRPSFLSVCPFPSLHAEPDASTVNGRGGLFNSGPLHSLRPLDQSCQFLTGQLGPRRPAFITAIGARLFKPLPALAFFPQPLHIRDRR
jgi:hypothetical protein